MVAQRRRRDTGTRVRGRTARGAAVAAAIAAASAMAPAASAAPPHGDDGHTHHVITGDGGCVPLDAVAFDAVPRGLHLGATRSGRERGPWHGDCS